MAQFIFYLNASQSLALSFAESIYYHMRVQCTRYMAYVNKSQHIHPTNKKRKNWMELLSSAQHYDIGFAACNSVSCLCICISPVLHRFFTLLLLLLFAVELPHFMHCVVGKIVFQWLSTWKDGISMCDFKQCQMTSSPLSLWDRFYTVMIFVDIHTSDKKKYSRLNKWLWWLYL